MVSVSAAHTAIRAAIAVALSGSITVPTLAQDGPNTKGDSVIVVSVKFREGLQVRAVAGTFRTALGARLHAVQAILAAHNNPEARPLIALPPGCPQDLERAATDSCRTRRDLSSWYRLFVPGTTDVDHLIAELNALAEVDTAYVAPKPVRPPRVGFPTPEPDAAKLASARLSRAPAPLSRGRHLEPS